MLCWEGRSSTQMDVCQRPSYCPARSNWGHTNARNTTYNSSTTLPQNPFCKLSEFESDASDIQYVEEYHSYQLSCYVQPSAITPTDDDNKSTAATASHQEGKPPSRLWLRRTLQSAGSLLSIAKETIRAAGLTTARRLDQARADISTWWLASRRMRLWLGRLRKALPIIILSRLVAQWILAQDRPVYVLVHVCQSWSVVVSVVPEPVARTESGHM
ncbi:uncharacterized protein BDZ83DRAFT_377381 [Colletotrichum acutatum]|uniref:Uncharacterized protein n=1 Tax=Glomerella acutata TaxID=27357 RepID=A0AAD8XNJ3_GLOAC|nr:uncharacterized protein BDZ83DRAFT_377381 [Colletotrichum acutatum]KAK1730624.1 hypothetical protein BDZ83DRAFT_377381 [Colletotrichum acutatum]